MPVFNGEKYIGESIDSILAQTYKHFELIIVNDGSTDGTLQIIKKYTDARIKLINHSENLGLAVARNKGFEVSRGKYITILDSDDIAIPIRIEEQVNFMESNLEFGLIGSQVQPINSNGQVCGSVWEYLCPAEQIPIFCYLIIVLPNQPFYSAEVAYLKSGIVNLFLLLKIMICG
jgi:glycosyltransferase involved in cell wall biosynthesis